MKIKTLEHQLKSWMIFLVIIPSVLIMAIYTISQIQVAKHKNSELIGQRVDFTKRLIEYWIEERAKNVRTISQSPAFRLLDERRMQDNLELMQRLNNDFDSLSYIDKDGFFKMTTLKGKIRFASTAGQPYYQAASMGREYISDVVIGRNSGLPIINFSAPVYNYNGNFQGLILGSVRTRTLETLLRNNWIGQTEDIMLVSSQGIMIAQPKHVNKLIGEGLLEGPFSMKIKLPAESLLNLHLGETGTAAWKNYLNQKVLGAYHYIPERDWTLIGSIDEDEILTPIYTQLGIMAAGTCILLFLLLPLATYITNRVKRPIDWLIEQSNFIAREEYDSLVEKNRFSGKLPYEVDHLCGTFVNMSHKIKTTVQLLRENEAKLANEIIERKLVEEARREEAKERTRIEKVASLGILVAGVAHEINQPLNAIKVASGAILYWHKQGRALDMRRIVDDVKSIAGQADRIDQIIRNIRSFAKPDRQLQIPLHMNETIQKIVQFMGIQFKVHDIQLRLTLCQPDNEILIVPAALEGIIINLLSNAMQALDSVEQAAKQIEVITRPAGEPGNQIVVLEIHDNGPGIREELLTRIFEPFFSTKSAAKSMGLGLSIVHSFVETNQGTIYVENKADGGATFRVEFPVYQAGSSNEPFIIPN